MRRAALLATAFAAAAVAASSASANAPAGWAGAVDARRDLGAAQTALVLGDAERSRALVARADTTLTAIAPQLPAALRRDLVAALTRARAAAGGDARELARARAAAWTTLLRAGLIGAVADARDGDAAAARQWLLVRDFRAPTRFTRAGTDATLAVSALAQGKTQPAAAARAIRTDLLDTYEAKLRAALDDAVAASRRGFAVRLAEEVALARGYATIVEASYRSQRGDAARRPARERTRAPRDDRGRRQSRPVRRCRRQCRPPSRRVQGGAARGRRTGPPRGSARPFPPTRADRVRPRRRRDTGHARIRDPGGDQLPQRRRRRAGGRLAGAARARSGGDPRADHHRRWRSAARWTPPSPAGRSPPRPSAGAPIALWS